MSVGAWVQKSVVLGISRPGPYYGTVLGCYHYMNPGQCHSMVKANSKGREVVGRVCATNGRRYVAQRVMASEELVLFKDGD